MRALALLSFALVSSSLAAQGNVARHALPKPASNVLTTAHYWTARLSATEILGGSFFANRSSPLRVSKPLSILGATTALPRVVVARETTSPAASNFYGLSAKGEWVKVTLATPGPVRASFSEELAVIDTGGPTSALWNPWSGTWVPFPRTAGGKPVTVVLEDTLMVTYDGSALTGYSAFGKAGVALPVTHPNVRYLDDDQGGGSKRGKQNSRSALMFETGPKEVACFSAYTQRWTKIPVSDASKITPFGPVVIEYERNLILLGDGNTAIFYSAFTGNAKRQTFGNLQKVLSLTDKLDLYDLEDSVGVLVDPGTTSDTGYVYRAIDDAVLAVPGLPAGTQMASGGGSGNPPPRPGGIADDQWAGFVLGDFAGQSVRMQLTSGLIRGAGWARASLAGENIVIFGNQALAGSNDTLFGIATNRAIYAYSALANSTSRLPYVGLINIALPPAVNDFIMTASVLTLGGPEVYVYPAREARWIRQKVSTRTTAGADDGVLWLRDGNTLRVIGSESRAFRTVNLASNPILLGDQDAHVHWVRALSGGGSEIGFFGRISDDLVTARTKATLKSTDVLVHDVWLLARTPSEIVTITAIPDLNAQHSWVMDNRPYPAIANSGPARFLARGPAGGAHFLIVGAARGMARTIPPFAGRLQIDLSKPFAAARIGSFDARGLDAFTLPMPPAGGTLWMQNFWIDKPLTTAGFGQMLPFAIH